MDLYAIHSDNAALIGNPHHSAIRRSNPLSAQNPHDDDDDDHDDDLTPAPESKPKDFLVVTTKTEPRDRTFGFRHGRHADSLILLGERGDGVSKRQFDIRPIRTGDLFIFNQSQYGTEIQLADQGPIHLKDIGDKMQIPDDLDFLNILRPVALRIVFYKRAGPEWDRFCGELDKEIPTFNNLELQSMNSTILQEPVGKRRSDGLRNPPEKRVRFESPSQCTISKLDIRHMSCRLLFQPGNQPIQTNGGTWEELNQLDDQTAEPVLCLAVQQTKQDPICRVLLPFSCGFLYYPFGDEVELQNTSGSVLTVDSWESTPSLDVERNRTTTLVPGCWKVRDKSGNEFQVRVQPRPYSVELLDASQSKQFPDISARVNKDKLQDTWLRIADAARSSVFLLKHVFRNKQMLIYRGRVTTEEGRKRMVLVKFVRSTNIGILRAALSWEWEFGTLKDLGRSDGILPLLDADARLGMFIFADMSALPLAGEPWCRSGMFTGFPSDAERILQDVTKALEKLEAKRLRHDSVGPMHVLYGRETGAYLIGFEFVRPFGNKRARGHGTQPWYAAPEQPEDRVDAKSHIWSLGILSMALLKKTHLTGFPKLSASQQGEDVATKKLSFRGKPGWEDVDLMLQQMLEADPHRRVSASTLCNTLGGNPISLASRYQDQIQKDIGKQSGELLQSKTSGRIGNDVIHDQPPQPQRPDSQFDEEIHHVDAESLKSSDSPWVPLSDILDSNCMQMEILINVVE